MLLRNARVRCFGDPVSRLNSVLDQIDASVLTPDSDSFVSLLRDCKEAKALPEGRRLHRHIGKHGLDRGAFLGSLLVQMYAHCGSPEDAQSAFDRIVEPNSFSWNMLLSAFAHKGHLSEAERVFDKMPQPDTVSWNIMITAYGQSGQLDSAKLMFDRSPRRDLVTWNALIAAFAKNECGDEALDLFRQMDLEGFLPNTVTFVSLLDACSSIKSCSLKLVKFLHSLIAPLGYLSNVVVATALLNLYGKCQEMGEAKKVFDQMPSPSPVSWTTMMILYLQNGDLQQGKDLFHQMPQRTVVSWNAMVGAYAQKGQAEEAKAVFDLMSNYDIVSLNSMVAAYANAGHMDLARNLFHELPETNLVSWNTMIAGYTQNGHLLEALFHFKTMQIEGITPNKVTFVAVLHSCACGGDLQEGKRAHRMILERGYGDVAVGNALIKLYTSCDLVEEAGTIFDSMIRPDAVSATLMINAYGKIGAIADARRAFDRMEEQDVIAWTAIVGAYAQNGHLAEAEKMFKHMPVRDQMAWNTMLVAYGQNNRIEDAKRHFDKMLRRDAVTWNAMISAYAQNGDCRMALRLFPLMDLDGEQPSNVTFLTVLDACSLSGAVAEGRIIHSLISDTQLLTQSIEIGTTLVNMYGRCGSLIYAKAAFDRMPRKSYISWNSLITAYAQNGHGEEAMDLTRLMELEGLISNEVTFLSNLFACSHAGMLEDGWKWFVSMQGDYGIQPYLDHYHCMVDLLGRSGTMEDAKDLMENMPFEPNPVGWKALLGASRTHCDVKQGVAAAESYAQLHTVDSSLYVLMSNMYTN